MLLTRARRGWLLGFASVALLGVGVAVVAFAQVAAVQTTRQISQYFMTRAVNAADGTSLEESVIIGPPVPPPGYDLERSAVALPEPNQAMGVNTLTVPAYAWTFGCSATSGAMIAAYYDRNGFPSMYTGPTNGGVMPLDSSSWGTWTDGASATYAQCPLAASRNGLDGRVTRGSIDDYWVAYNSSASDPYITNAWTQHPWGDAIGDYMYTSQSAYGNTDGSTSFWNYTSSASPLPCSAMPGYSITNDGTYGRQLFYRTKGYTVTDCYNQRTDNTVSGGFSFAQFQAEIDAGRPVMLNLAGHTIVGIGYDTSTSTVYLHDTWDYLTHTMTWGGSYSGMGLLSVSIVNLQRSGMKFYALTPCRLVDTRNGTDPSTSKRGTFTSGETRAYTFSTSTDCPGLPSDAGGWAVHLSYKPTSVASYITVYPAGASQPATSTLLGYPGTWTGDNAVLPAGSGGTIEMYCQYAGNVIVDVEGYFK